MKMKRALKLSLLVVPFVLTSCTNQSDLFKTNNNLKANTSISSEVKTNFYNFLTGNYQLNTIAEIPFMGKTIKANIVDKVSEDLHHSVYSLDLTVSNQTLEIASGEFFYAEGSDLNTVEKYIAIDNTIQERKILDRNSNPIRFEGNYNSPFYYLNDIEIDNLESYFDISQTNSGYLFKLTQAGLDLFTTSFNVFFNQFSSKFIYNYDEKTHTTSLKDLVVTTDNLGNPTEMEFTRVEADFYGATYEYYSSSFTKLDEVPSLEPVVNPDLTSSQKEKFTTSLNSLYDEVKKGNFTQTVQVKSHTLDQSNNVVSYDYTYNNYYDLVADGAIDHASLGMMFSDLALYDVTNGETYIGLAYSSEQSSYYAIGVSPEANYSGALDENYYADVNDLLPSVGKFGVDLFSCSENEGTYTYSFDLANFNYNDFYFSVSVLDNLLGLGDPISRLGMIVNDTVTYEYALQNLDIVISSDNKITFSLDYLDSYNEESNVTISFSDFGTTNLEEVEALQPVLETLNYVAAD